MEQETLVPEELPPLVGGPASPVPGSAALVRRWRRPARSRPVRSSQAAWLSSGALRGRLLWAVVEAQGADYQLVIAERPVGEVAERLKGHEDAFIGNVGDSGYYDATIDTEMALALLRVASGGARDGRAVAAPVRRTVQHLPRLRRPADPQVVPPFDRSAPTPTSRSPQRWPAPGSPHIALPLVRWQRNGRDLAFGQQYLAGGSDGLGTGPYLPAGSLRLRRPRDTSPTRRCRGAISPQKRTAWAR